MITNSELELLKETIYDNPYVKLEPYPKQLKPIREANKFISKGNSSILVGAGGYGGKTVMGSMLAAQYLEYTDYTCLVTRLNYAELTGTDSIWENLVDWTCDETLENPCESNESKLRIKSPSGATIWFKAFDNVKKKQKVKSESYVRIINDEASELEPEILRFLYRSLRKDTTNHIPLSFINLSNPGGPSTKYLVEKYIEGDNKYFPLDWRDNPFINKEQYKNTLDELDYIDKQYQMYGNWNFVPSSGDLINRDILESACVTYEDYNKYTPIYNAIGIDLASTGRDKTAATSVTMFENGQSIVTGTMTHADSYPENSLVNFIYEQYTKFNTNTIIIEKEAGSSPEYAMRYWTEVFRELINDYGIMLTSEKPYNSKFARARPIALHVQQGRLKFDKDCPDLEELFNQFIYVHPDPTVMKENPSPDLLDSLGYANSNVDMIMTNNVQISGGKAV
jgi:hypothetical protein